MRRTMAAYIVSAASPPLTSKFAFHKTRIRISPISGCSFRVQTQRFPSKSKLCFPHHSPLRLRGLLAAAPLLTKTKVSSHVFHDSVEETDSLPFPQEQPGKILLWVLFWASLSLAWFAASGDAKAAADSIKASSFGLKIASALRNSGWADEAVVFSLATLPVLELRGAIPVGYWMQLNPVLLTVLSVLGNMVPVPFIILYLKKFASFLAARNATASKFMNVLFQRAKEKAGPVEEFQWLGLMLFVAVPFPGTGAWTGAIIASILDMPFWSALSANFFGVVFAGLLVNLLVNLGLKYAIITGIVLFVVSTFMWSILRKLKSTLISSN